MINSIEQEIDRRKQARDAGRRIRDVLAEPAAIVHRVRKLQQSMHGDSWNDVQSHVMKLRRFVMQGESVYSEQILTLAAAVVCEAVHRLLSLRLYDVQVQAGVVLAHGGIAEMATGEGKTLAGLIPAVVHALKGRGVHVATPNSYLARRDFETLSTVIEHIGMRAGLIEDESDRATRSAAYACDITYGPSYAFGFDYLRDQVALRAEYRRPPGEQTMRLLRGQGDESITVQRGHDFALLDEVDHVLVDDAISPLVLSNGVDREATDALLHIEACRFAKQLSDGIHFAADDRTGRIRLTPDGLSQIYRDNQHSRQSNLRRPWHDYVTLALHAAKVLQRDVDYVIQDAKVQIIDPATGRIFADRSWSDGQHQAVEAKEGLEITEQRDPVATITRQRFFRMYSCLSGMTGTAIGCGDELARVYGLHVQGIPLRVPCRRTHEPTKISANQSEKARQIMAEVTRHHRLGRPVLVGTQSIAESEEIARHFRSAGMQFSLLNGKQDAKEATIISAAGKAGAITIATNMAGRGTDIRLDEKALRAGGLHVVVTQCHALERVNRQLIGRAARGGDPGSFRQFVALDDPIVSKSAPWIQRWMSRRLRHSDLDTRMLDRLIERVQRVYQKRTTAIRLQLLQQDLLRQQHLQSTCRPSGQRIA